MSGLFRAGYRKGFNDPGNHFRYYFIDEMRPKAVLFENVKNLVGHDKNTFKVIKKEILSRNYSFNAKVINTKIMKCSTKQRKNFYSFF